jgi:excinuclease UvrABC nuclease subunit
MTWEKADEEDHRVDKPSEWVSLDSYQEELEKRAGVYIFTDDDFDVKYIGKAGAGRMVVELKNIKTFEVYSAIKRLKNIGATQVKALYTNSDARALEYEGELIKKYNPPNNGVDLVNS